MFEKIVGFPYCFVMAIFGRVFDLPWDWVRLVAFFMLLPFIAPVVMYAAYVENKEERLRKETGG